MMITGRNRKNKRQALLFDAAGKLLVEMRDVRAVVSRAIAAFAHTSKSAIDCHFDNKAGFLNAVLNELRQLHGCCCIIDFLNKNESMLENREGQILFISLLPDEFQKYFMREGKNICHILLRQEVIQSRRKIGNRILAFFLETDMEAFYALFKKITGRDDVNKVHAWCMNIILPLSTRGYRKNKLNFSGPLAPFPDYDEFYLEFYKRPLMAGRGLISFPGQLCISSGEFCRRKGA